MPSEALFPGKRGPDEKLMKIHDQNPANLNPAGASGSRNASQVQGNQPVHGPQGSGGAEAAQAVNQGPDRVSLSNLAATLQPAAPDREAELERLGALYDRGLYEPDVGAIAEGLIQDGLWPLSGDGGTETGTGE